VDFWDFALLILAPIGVFIIRVYANDDRPEARVFTIGCGAIVIILAIVFVIRFLH
jgi:hypothetical protein